MTDCEKNNIDGLAADILPQSTGRGLLAAGARFLLAAGVPDGSEDAQALFCFAFDMQPYTPPYFALQKAAPGPEKAALFAGLLQRRAGREPLQYLLGKWQFMGHDLFTGPGVLIPRDDTEVLCRAVQSHFAGTHGPLCGMDLCAGTGAVSIGVCSLLPGARVQAIELYASAWTYLTKNLALYPGYAISALRGDVLQPPAQQVRTGVDFLVSNPPYIAADKLGGLAPELAREPRTALDGGDDGLVFYRALAAYWLQTLRPGGFAAFEIGEEQAQAVRGIFEHAGRPVKNFAVIRDIAGLDRVVSFTVE